jgi:hypothetical protein
MNRPNERQAKALQELRNNSEVIGYLQTRLEEAKNNLVTQYETDLLRVLQGEARTLQFLIDCITKDFYQQSGKR